MSLPRAIYVVVDDWVGLYIDDELVAEGESINLPHLLGKKRYEFSVRNGHDADLNYVQNVGGLPENLDGLWDNEHMWNVDHEDEEDDEEYE